MNNQEKKFCFSNTCKTALISSIVLPMLMVNFLLGWEIHVVKQTQDQSIKETIERAQHGDTILVKSGIYNESEIKINKKLTLYGEKNSIIKSLDGEKIITITADSVVISGFEFKNVKVSYISDNAALKIDDAKHCRVENNTFTNNFFAIYLAKASDCIIRKNIIKSQAKRESASGNGIHLWYCKNISISNNYVSGHRDGIYFEFVEDSHISHNESEKNLRYGLHFMFSDRCKYSYNTFTNNGAGVAVMYTHNVEMTHNRFQKNWGSAAFGLLLKEISDSKIENNVFYQNSRALYAESTNRIQVLKNTFDQNGWAIKIMGNCLNNKFKDNNFSGNTFDVATNSRQNFNTFDSNFWDNYSGYDLDHDGFGDVAYRPVSLFSFLVEQNEPALTLMRSFFVQILNISEKIMPVLTPETLVDQNPRMWRIP